GRERGGGTECIGHDPGLVDGRREGVEEVDPPPDAGGVRGYRVDLLEQRLAGATGEGHDDLRRPSTEHHVLDPDGVQRSSPTLAGSASAASVFAAATASAPGFTVVTLAGSAAASPRATMSASSESGISLMKHARTNAMSRNGMRYQNTGASESA